MSMLSCEFIVSCGFPPIMLMPTAMLAPQVSNREVGDIRLCTAHDRARENEPLQLAVVDIIEGKAIIEVSNTQSCAFLPPPAVGQGELEDPSCEHCVARGATLAVAIHAGEFDGLTVDAAHGAEMLCLHPCSGVRLDGIFPGQRDEAKKWDIITIVASSEPVKVIADQDPCLKVNPAERGG